MPAITPTQEQIDFEKFYLENNDSILLEAVAGSGKTTTILSIIPKTKGTSIICAFNKSISKELDFKLNEMGVDWRQCRASTVHSIGYSAYKKLYPNFVVDKNKVGDIIQKFLLEVGDPTSETKEDKEQKNEFIQALKKLVSVAKQNGFGFLHDAKDLEKWGDLIDHYDIMDFDFDAVEFIKMGMEVLKRSNKLTETIDFDDMIYMPLLYKARFWAYDNVFIDEAQDINALRRELVRRITKSHGRVIAVGDRNQAIFGFTGADSSSMDSIKNQFKSKELTLSNCFRCGKDIVEFSKKWNPKIEAFEKNHKGEVKNMTLDEFLVSSHNKTDVMLCRNTKPLIDVAFKMIKRGVPVHVEGRDIGDGLINIIKKWNIITLDALKIQLDTYKKKQIERYLFKKNDEKIQLLEDKIDTLNVFIERCRINGKNTVEDLKDDIRSIFKDSDNNSKNVFTLSTIHKSKGREFPKVYWLDRNGTLPSKYAKLPWQKEQENNLCYVAATRAINELIEVTV